MLLGILPDQLLTDIPAGTYSPAAANLTSQVKEEPPSLTELVLSELQTYKCHTPADIAHSHRSAMLAAGCSEVQSKCMLREPLEDLEIYRF